MLRLPVASLIDAMNRYLTTLYGIELREENNANDLLWAKRVQCYSVYDRNGNVLGHLYLDMYARQNKDGDVCHMTVRCHKRLEDGSEQKPIVVLSLDFPSSVDTVPLPMVSTLCCILVTLGVSCVAVEQCVSRVRPCDALNAGTYKASARLGYTMRHRPCRDAVNTERNECSEESALCIRF